MKKKKSGIKIKILVKSKNGIIQNRYIKKENKKFYTKTKKAYIKKSKDEIVKLRTKQVQLSKIKQIEVKPKLKEKKTKITKGFNYTHYYKGINHNGYIRMNDIVMVITEDITNSELSEYYDKLVRIMHQNYNSIPKPLRMFYIRLHYRVQKSNNPDDLSTSAQTTRISFNLNDLENNLNHIFDLIVAIVESYILVDIFRMEFANIEFNSILRSE